jgi:hypothetical protein
MTAQPVAADNQRQAQASSSRFQTTRTFELDASRAARTFTFRERSGVILVNRLTVPHGVRAFVDARIPHLAGARESQAGRAATARGVRKLGRMDCRGILNPWRPARPPQLCIAADKGFQRLRERLPVISQCPLGVADHDECSPCGVSKRRFCLQTRLMQECERSFGTPHGSKRSRRITSATPLIAVVALEPVVDEGSAGSQAREARTRATRGPDLRTPRVESRLAKRVVAAVGHRLQAEGSRPIRQAGEGRSHASGRGSSEALLEDAERIRAQACEAVPASLEALLDDHSPRLPRR